MSFAKSTLAAVFAGQFSARQIAALIVESLFIVRLLTGSAKKARLELPDPVCRARLGFFLGIAALAFGLRNPVADPTGFSPVEEASALLPMLVSEPTLESSLH